MREEELMRSIDFPTTFSELQDFLRARLQKPYDKERTTFDMMLDSLIESKDWRAKLAVMEMIWGKPSLHMEHSGAVTTVFQVEYSEDWKLEVTEAEEDVVDAEYTVIKEDDTHE